LYGADQGGGLGAKFGGALNFRRLATDEEVATQQQVVAGLEHNKYSSEYKVEAEKLDWMQKHTISDGFREFLGEMKDPNDRIVRTFQKVWQNAIAGRFFDAMDNGIDQWGNKTAYDTASLKQVRELKAYELSKGEAKYTADNPGPDAIPYAKLARQAKELDAYDMLPEGARYGKLAGKWVSRFVRDELNTSDTPFKWMNNSIMRGVASFNNMIKLGHAPLNPFTCIRNYWQIGLFMLTAGVKPEHIGEAWNILRNGKNPETLALMRENHLLSTNYVGSELKPGASRLSSGFLDTDIAMRLAKNGMNTILKEYSFPDQLVRAGAFLSNRSRLAQQALTETPGKFTSLQEAMADPTIIKRAANATERYTMNYDEVPAWVKAARQLPFVSLYMSYTSEITKILKNLTMDVISPHPDGLGRLHAMSVLGGMAAIPAMMVAGAESNLSPQDQKDWAEVKRLMPAYSRSRFQIPTSRDADGRFHFWDITNMVQADSYSQMINAVFQGDIKGALQANPIFDLQNTPALNIVSEQVSGEDQSTGQKYGDNIGLRFRGVMKELLPPIIPPGFEGQRIERTFTPNDQGTLGLTNMRTGVQTTPSNLIASYMAGMRFGNVELGTVQRQALADAQDKLAIQKSFMNQVTNMNSTPEAKLAAQDHYTQAAQNIFAELNHKITGE
jgi:hypothetical protein